MKFTMITHEVYKYRHLHLQDSTLGPVVSTLAVHKLVYNIDTSSYKVVFLACTTCVICLSEVSSSTKSVLA